MATIITKNSSTASSVPTNAQLVQGELAVNVTDKRLFTENASGTVVELGTNPSSLTLPNGTANGLAFLNASKVLTTGSALTFDGTNYLNVTGLRIGGSDTTNTIYQATGALALSTGTTSPITFNVNLSEGMRLTSTGLGIGTSSPGAKLHVESTTGNQLRIAYNSSFYWKIERDPSTGSLKFTDVSTERLNLDQNGNLGLGVTPSAWGSSFSQKAAQVGPVGSLSSLYASSSNVQTNLACNAYDFSSSPTYIAAGAALAYRMTSSGHAWYTAPSGTAGNAISFTQAMTLDASSNLTVGGAVQLIDTNTSLSVNSSTKEFKLTNAWGAGFFTFSTNGSERARIDSSGNLLVGTTSAGGEAGLSILPNNSNGAATLFWDRASTSSTSTALNFENGNATVGSVTYTNTGTAYNTSSDYRLKENIQPMTGALAKVAALKPCTYKWKADGSEGEGFIAHELAEVVPQCVTGEKDAVDAEGKPVYQGIDTSFLVATLTAAIQEQQAIIQSLTARVAALEAT